jgi:hypothetical protein
MANHIEKECPKCGQMLRFPLDVGGILMACPSCGNKFSSDFKLGGVGQQKGLFMKIFEMPKTILDRIGRFFK